MSNVEPASLPGLTRSQKHERSCVRSGGGHAIERMHQRLHFQLAGKDPNAVSFDKVNHVFDRTLARLHFARSISAAVSGSTPRSNGKLGFGSRNAYRSIAQVQRLAYLRRWPCSCDAVNFFKGPKLQRRSIFRLRRVSEKTRQAKLQEQMRNLLSVFFWSAQPPQFRDKPDYGGLIAWRFRYVSVELSNGSISISNLPKPNLPLLRGVEPETAAEMLRQKWSLGQRPIKNMIHLVEAHGVRVFSLASWK